MGAATDGETPNHIARPGASSAVGTEQVEAAAGGEPPYCTAGQGGHVRGRQ